MTTPSPAVTRAEAVAATYTARARFALAEAQHSHQPPVLADLLSTARHVLELPCAGGHFLPAYTRAQVRVTLADANPAMLAVAASHAQQVGLPTSQVDTLRCLLPEVPPQPGVDLIVVPNAAVNQLLDCCELTQLLTGLAVAAPGGRLLLQAVLGTADGQVDRCGGYDPAHPEGRWYVDRVFDPHQAGGAATRWRHQRRLGTVLNVRFDYRSDEGASLHTAAVTLHALSRDQLLGACTTAGLSHVRLHPDPGGPTQLVATLPGVRP